MSIIYDVDFENAHSLAEYKLRVAEQVPTDINIRDDFLNVIAGEVLFDTGLSAGESATLILKAASGEALVNGMNIKLLQAENVHLAMIVGRDGIIMLSVRGDAGSGNIQFKFSGYTLSKK